MSFEVRIPLAKITHWFEGLDNYPNSIMKSCPLDVLDKYSFSTWQIVDDIVKLYFAIDEPIPDSVIVEWILSI